MGSHCAFTPANNDAPMWLALERPTCSPSVSLSFERIVSTENDEYELLPCPLPNNASVGTSATDCWFDDDVVA